MNVVLVMKPFIEDREQEWRGAIIVDGAFQDTVTTKNMPVCVEEHVKSVARELPRDGVREITVTINVVRNG